MPASPINAVHEATGARFTDFGGWSMPLQYAGVIDEHLAELKRQIAVVH